MLGAAILAEIRGHAHADIMGRRTSSATLRQALAVALMGVGLVMSGTLVLLVVTAVLAEAALLEAVSAFGTVGLSTGITADLPATGQLTIIALMLIGRVGPINIANPVSRIVHGRRHRAAQRYIRLHTRKDPAHSERAGHGVFGHLIQGAPGGGHGTWERGKPPVGGGQLVIHTVVRLNR
ncbi:potassium transporter TrkG [Streptomyces sp. NBC_00286]|uniref:potassium transporter TrkG n=1 Tax=Streptomyces sp. NBC_00286 TaxID=2975701 RepID=UPI002E287F92|nr:potassium transporter TrkG [Streptomyces sp. NBC_00286]